MIKLEWYNEKGTLINSKIIENVPKTIAEIIKFWLTSETKSNKLTLTKKELVK